MMITKKLKAVLSLRGLTFVDYAHKLGITKQALNKKRTSDAYKISDLIKFGELTNAKLQFVDEETGEILVKFNKEDLIEKEKYL